MKRIEGQILASTRLDIQGERNSKEALESFALAFAGRRLPLNQQHNLALPVTGYVENLRVIPDPASPGDWQLIGNVSLDRDGDTLPSGFSLSYKEKLRHSQRQEQIEVFLPYPHYNDSSLIDEVFEDGYTSVGRIVRKEASPESIALIVSVAVAVLQPLWEDVYRSKIAPSIERFFQGRFSSLGSRGIGSDLIQHIDYGSHSAQVVFIPIRGKEAECFVIDKLCGGMFLVHEYLHALDVNHVPASKVILVFERAEGKFVIKAVHFIDGNVKTSV